VVGQRRSANFRKFSGGVSDSDYGAQKRARAGYSAQMALRARKFKLYL
jgi:hypothetical protein